MTSWMIDYVLGSIPSWFWLIGSGVSLAVFLVSGIFSHFPGIGIYAKVLRPVTGIITLACVFMYGGAGVQAMWEEKVRVAQEEADKKAAMAQQLNEDLTKERHKKAQVRIEYRDRIKTEIQVQKEVIDKDCKIDPKVPELLNKAAKNPIGESK
jgi:hypothetical protein